MNEVMENILTRRSCRSFREDKIPPQQLNDILKAAVYAPSGMGRQTWQFTALTDRDDILRLAEAVGRVLHIEGYYMYRPSVLILVSNDRESPFGCEDNACALENIFLAAHSYGIGSVWINQLREICDLPGIRAFLTRFGVPDKHVIYGCAALGYPAEPLPGEIAKTGVIKIVE